MDRHAVAGTDEANWQSHHELLEQMGQLVDREQVLTGENVQLRAKLVELKREENKKYDDLLVEYYDIKRKYDDDHQPDNEQQQQMDTEGTSANKVTVKTESSDEDVKEIIKLEIKEEEYENVKVKIKQEIKEEYEEDHEDYCGGCDRCIVKQELVSDDDDVNSMQLYDLANADEVMQHNSNQSIDTFSRDHLNTPTNSVFQCDAPPNEQQMEVTNSLVTDDSVDQQAIGSNGDLLEQSTQMFQSKEEQANNNEVMNHENALADEENQEMSNSTNDNHDRSVVEFNEPSTSARRRRSNRVTTEQPTTSTPHNVNNKRKQSQSNRTVKKSKKTIEYNDGVEEDIANEDQVDNKIKVLHLNCTVSNCVVKSNSLTQLGNHLRTSHELLPFRCFVLNCNCRCDNPAILGHHIKHQHSNPTQFECHVCHKEFASQHETYNHWRYVHLIGQFRCNLNDCAKVYDTRSKVRSHQQYKHCPESERFECPRAGCSSSFVTKRELERHERTHLNTRSFHCSWHQCSHRTNLRENLLKHIRARHFGLPLTMKEQTAKNIVDVRDPNEFVRVEEQVDE